jgi:hypothetical protein
MQKMSSASRLNARLEAFGDRAAVSMERRYAGVGHTRRAEIVDGVTGGPALGFAKGSTHPTGLSQAATTRGPTSIASDASHGLLSIVTSENPTARS